MLAHTIDIEIVITKPYNRTGLDHPFVEEIDIDSFVRLTLRLKRKIKRTLKDIKRVSDSGHLLEISCQNLEKFHKNY